MTSTLPPALTRLFKPHLSAQNHSRTLYETLSRLPHDGLGARVTQARWAAKGIHGCYWEVTKVQTKHSGTHGKAWGRLTWRGEEVKTVRGRKPAGARRIPGGLKYGWKLAEPDTTQNVPQS